MKAARGVATNSAITHKELLTFTNLTNLEWEFAKLRVTDETGDTLTGEDEEYLPLDELLDPETFVRYDSEEDAYFYSYVEGKFEEERQLKDKEKEEGLANMRREAGIAMEYLKKWQKWEETNKEEGTDEGKFLGDWEVIYGADSYKVVDDYLKDLYNTASEIFGESTSDNPSPCPPRGEIESAEDLKTKLEISFEAAEFMLSVGTWQKKLLGLTGMKELTAEKIAVEVTENLIEKELTALVNKTDSVPLTLLAIAFLNHDSAASMMKNLSPEVEQELKHRFGSEVTSKKIAALLREKIDLKLTQELKITDNGFRVVAFKKDNQIVVAYKREEMEDKSKLLPEEVDYLQIVYNRLKRQNQGAEITFTGYEGGANLSFINALFTNQEEGKVENVNSTLFYNTIEQLMGYINFTPHDIDKEYKGKVKAIVTSNLEEIADTAAEQALALTLAQGITQYFSLNQAVGAAAGMGTAGQLALTGGTVITAANLLIILAVTAAAWGLRELFQDWLENKELEAKYNLLKDWGLIEEQKNKIKGYITDKLLEQDYLELVIDTVQPLPELADQDSKLLNTIKVKKEDALYFLLNKDELKFIENPYQSNNDVEYLVPHSTDYALDKQSVEMIAPTMGEAASEVERYWRLVNKDGIYEIEGKIIESAQYNDPFQPLTKEDREKLGEVQMLTNLLEIIGRMQHNYINKKEEILEFVYPVEKKVGIDNQIPEQVEQGGFNDLFAFLPFLDTDGNLASGNELRQDYIASLLKSTIQLGTSGKVDAVDDSIMRDIKYKLQQPQNKYNFCQNKVKSEFIKIIEETLESRYGTYFNHSRLILNDFKQDKIALEDYCKIDEIAVEENEAEEEEGKPYKFDPEGAFIIDTLEKFKLEYSYNPRDFIFSGPFEVKGMNLPEEKTEDSAAQNNNRKEASADSILEPVAVYAITLPGEAGENLLKTLSAQTGKDYESLRESDKTYDSNEELIKKEGAPEPEDSGVEIKKVRFC